MNKLRDTIKFKKPFYHFTDSDLDGFGCFIINYAYDLKGITYVTSSKDIKEGINRSLINKNLPIVLTDISTDVDNDDLYIFDHHLTFEPKSKKHILDITKCGCRLWFNFVKSVLGKKPSKVKFDVLNRLISIIDKADRYVENAVNEFAIGRCITDVIHNHRDLTGIYLDSNNKIVSSIMAEALLDVIKNNGRITDIEMSLLYICEKLKYYTPNKKLKYFKSNTLSDIKLRYTVDKLIDRSPKYITVKDINGDIVLLEYLYDFNGAFSDIAVMLRKVRNETTKIKIVGNVTLEEKKGGVVISFRSDNTFDSSEIAKRLGGGGHFQAAGARLKDFKYSPDEYLNYTQVKHLLERMF